MASAVLASRNEPYWGEHKVYMRKYTNNSTSNPHLNSFNPNPSVNPNPNSKPNPNFSRQIHESSTKRHLWQSNEPSPRSPLPPAYKDSTLLNCKTVGFNDRSESSCGDWVTFDLSVYSRRELKQLKKRLISELEQVRSLRNRIEGQDFEARPTNHAPQLSGSLGGGREVPRPPPIQLNQSLDAPIAVTAASKEKRTPKADQQHRNSKFIPGKNKKVLGQKRGRPFSPGKGLNRPPVKDSQIDKLVTSMMKRCEQILMKLMKHKHSWVFNKPVDAMALGLHDYHKIIKHPMDLGTVKSRLEKNGYGSPLDFASDVRLTFNNAMTYNPKGQDVHIMAETLFAMFDQMFNPAYQRYEAEHRRVVATKKVNQEIWAPSLVPPTLLPRALPESIMIAKKSDSNPRVQSTLLNPPTVQPSAVPVTTTEPVVLHRPTAPVTTTEPVVSQRPVVKLPKPKAKDPNKRLMSFEDKAKLGASLLNLPPEKMDQLLQIIKRRNTHLEQDGDEIELDIEAIDNETLWELDRFVSYHKKTGSKMKREGFISNTISTLQINKSPVSEPTPEAAANDKKEDAGEEDVDIGEDIPVNNFPPVVIEKDAACASRSSSSSSSSSSSDCSSSGDSESGSSSGSDSDKGSVQSPFVESKEAPVT